MATKELPYQLNDVKELARDHSRWLLRYANIYMPKHEELIPIMVPAKACRIKTEKGKKVKWFIFLFFFFFYFLCNFSIWHTGSFPFVILREMNQLNFHCNGHPLTLYVWNWKINKRSNFFWCEVLDVAESIEWYFVSIIYVPFLLIANYKFFSFIWIEARKEQSFVPLFQGGE